MAISTSQNTWTCTDNVYILVALDFFRVPTWSVQTATLLTRIATALVITLLTADSNLRKGHDLPTPTSGAPNSEKGVILADVFAHVERHSRITPRLVCEYSRIRLFTIAHVAAMIVDECFSLLWYKILASCSRWRYSSSLCASSALSSSSCLRLCCSFCSRSALNSSSRRPRLRLAVAAQSSSLARAQGSCPCLPDIRREKCRCTHCPEVRTQEVVRR